MVESNKSMNLPEKNKSPWRNLLDLLATNWVTERWRDVGVVVGCSGGADSVALLRLMAELRTRGETPPKGFLIAAHLNHGLRGSASDGDQRFVETLSERLGVRCQTERATGKAESEADMRSIRMQFLTDTAYATGARYIALAHSADDNAETFIHHLLRGTGPAGMTGINRTRAIDSDLVLVRPLLTASRHDIRQSLSEIDQPWCEDSSNSNTCYQRNWIRHELLPLIEQRYPRAIDAINRAMSGQREWRTLVDKMADEWLHHHMVKSSIQPHPHDRVSLKRDSSIDAAVVIAAMQILWSEKNWSRGTMSRDHWCRLAGTIQSGKRERYSLPGSVDVDATDSVIHLLKTDPDSQAPTGC